MSGRFDPMADLTPDNENANSQMSDIPLQLPANANVASNISALVTFSQAEGDPMWNVPSLHAVPSQTEKIRGNYSFPVYILKGSPAVLGHQETVQLVTQ